MSTSNPFTQGLEAGALRYQRCTDCGQALTGQRFACTVCGGAQLAWCDAAGTGTVYAVSTVHRAPTEAWRALVPYTLVLVNLDEGPRVMAHGAPGLAIGSRVAAQAVTLAGQALVRFSALATVPHAPAPPAAAG